MNISFRKARPLFLVVGSGTSLAALTVGTIFEGFLLPTTGGGLLPEIYAANPFGLWIFYTGFFAVSAFSAALMYDAGRAIVSSFISFAIAAALTFFVLALPDLVGLVTPSGILQESSILFTFSALFPVAFFVNLFGTVAGIALGERFL